MNRILIINDIKMSTLNERIIRSNNIRKLRLAGILPMYIDDTTSSNIIRSIKDIIPFSFLYKTFNNYNKDIELAEKMLEDGRDIPNELFNKLRSTALELGLVDN